MKVRTKKKHAPVSKTKARHYMKAGRAHRAAILGTFEATKSGHAVKLAKGSRVARVECSSSPVAEIFIASARRWEASNPALELAEIAERALIEVEIGSRYIDDAVSFWRDIRPDWSMSEVLEHVAFETKAAIFASQRRRFGSCFLTAP